MSENNVKLFELLDMPLPWKWIRKLKSWDASFSVNDKKYFVRFTIAAPNTWEMYFWLYGARRHANELGLVSKTGLDITGTGDAVKVFSTVKSILEAFIKTVNPDDIFFTSDEEPSRVKLYDRFMLLFRSRGYNVHRSKDEDDEVVYHITKGK